MDNIWETTLSKVSALYPAREAKNLCRILWEDGLGKNRHTQLTELEKELIVHWTERLLQHEPAQYLVGKAHFYGLVLRVEPNVLIPRPETEELVEWIWQDHQKDRNKSLLDIGTGSGCIPLALKKQFLYWDITGMDISPEALHVARANGEYTRLEVTWTEADIFTWNPLRKWDIIVSNPPYIDPLEAESLPENVRLFEPYMALFSPEGDPLAFYVEIARFARQHLAEGGKLYFECSEFHVRQVASMLREQGYDQVTIQSDLQGKDRMVRASG